MNYYNDNDPFCCAVLRERMADGLIPEGVIDERDFRTIDYRELGRYKQVHLFAGIGGFALAARMAGWPDDRELWTAGFPCQPVSVAGKRLAQEDERWLWPWIARAVREVRPRLVMLENVPGLFHSGFGDVLGGLAEGGFDAEWGVVSAAAVGAPHLRERVWILAYPNSHGCGNKRERLAAISKPRCPSAAGSPTDVADTENDGPGRRTEQPERGEAAGRMADTSGPRTKQQVGFIGSRTMAQSNGSGRGGREDDEGQGQAERGRATAGGVSYPVKPGLEGHDIGEVEDAGEGRQHADATGPDWWSVEPDVGRVAYGVSARVDRLRALGNSIVPQVAAQILREYMTVGA